MTCLLVNTSGLSGGTYDVQDHKFGLSKLLAATWTDIVKRLMPCSVLVELSRQSCGSILSKGNLLLCSILRQIPVTLPRKTRVRRIPVTLPRKTRVRQISVTLFHKMIDSGHTLDKLPHKNSLAHIITDRLFINMSCPG